MLRSLGWVIFGEFFRPAALSFTVLVGFEPRITRIVEGGLAARHLIRAGTVR